MKGELDTHELTKPYCGTCIHKVGLDYASRQLKAAKTQPEAVAAAGADMILANTYHLMLRPGAETVAKLGGLQAFMNWSGPILTDSGGFQVMSLAGRRTMDEDGVVFSSHIDGSRHSLTPERAVRIQLKNAGTSADLLVEALQRVLATATFKKGSLHAEKLTEALRKLKPAVPGTQAC